MKDLTSVAVERQITAMRCQGYDIGIYDRAARTMAQREGLAMEELLRLVPRLRMENANGRDIYVRPAKRGNRALILLDDIDWRRLEEMWELGYGPACSLETSPENFQAWISLGPEPMTASQRKIAARYLAQLFRGDAASADASHYGRLAGFTNRKPCRLTERGYPFVLCRTYHGLDADRSAEIRELAMRQEALENQKIIGEVNATGPGENESSVSDGKNRKRGLREAGKAFESYYEAWKRFVEFHGKPLDKSRGDFAVSCKMLKLGYSAAETASAIMSHSPDVAERKASHIEDYASRTVRAAARACHINI
jgi:hypothetical protein